jgi:hypothetical protein
LKATAKAQTAKARQKATEREIRARRPVLSKRNPLNGDKKAEAAFNAAVKKLANKTASVKDLQVAMRAGEKAGLSQTEVWRVVKQHWNAAARKLGKKRNPGILGALETMATLAMGTSAALEIKRQLSPAKRPKAKPAAKRRNVPVRKTNIPSGGKRPGAGRPKGTTGTQPRPSVTIHKLNLEILNLRRLLKRTSSKRGRELTQHRIDRLTEKRDQLKRKQNPDGYAGFQGRESTKEMNLDGPVNLPKRTWVLGRLWELGVVGRTPLNFRRRDGKPTRRFWLLSDYANKYLWIAGPPMAHPDPTIKEGEVRPFGTLTSVCYETRKDHLDDEVDTPYEHDFGEEGGRKPILGIDRDGYAHIIGGDFIITDLGIKD